MSDHQTYNEEVRQYILDRYEELGHAAREMRVLYDARGYGKFTRRHTTVVRDLITAHLNEHFSGDADLPDLDEWDGFNRPQYIYSTGGGTGLIFWANQSGGVITDVSIDNNSDGQGYTYPPVLTLVTLPANDPTTVAELRPVMGEVTGCSITDEGDDYTSAPTVTISSPDDAEGIQATMEVIRGKVTSVSVNTAGSGYDADATVTIGSPDTGSDSATADITVVSGSIDSITLTHAGSGYTSATSITVNTTGGSGATFGSSYDDSVIAGCYIVLPGAGYTTQATATMSGGGGSGATFAVEMDSTVINKVHVVSGGAGYTNNPYPTETITPGLPDAPDSTEAQMEDDYYEPAGWTTSQPDTNTTDARYIYRSEREGRQGGWQEWEDPTVVDTYSST